ncbi:hypothetical protein Adt_32030 [Abeliophyllum distichum]|uniref:Uncharacterized protein n=1 Tax=Abeliophyllum distichum TaxID=126358 RepID=A0ABD1RGU1_9LAMI
MVDKKKTNRIRYADWIEFCFQEDDYVPNPRKSKPFKKAMEPKPHKKKRALNVPDEGGPKRLKFMFSSTENVSSLERVEKIPGTILVSEDSNSRDQASRGLKATFVPKDSSSEDQTSENLDMIDALDGIDGLNSSKNLL